LYTRISPTNPYRAAAPVSPVFVLFATRYEVTAKDPDEAFDANVPPFVEVYWFVPSKYVVVNSRVE
jgi:hypothetical protein